MTENSNEQAIRGLIETFVAGWNAADGNILASAFTEDADFTAITGLHARGRHLVALGHNEILSHIYRGTTLAAEVLSIHYLRPDVAVVDTKFMLQKDGRSFFPGVPYTSAGIIAIRENNTWAIAVFRNMVPYNRPVLGPVEKELMETRSA